ncbi:uncharacterized protein LOC134282507, partial [Saccostrea cucullata]|uniref:uncharacterized protein LOC134282507 n=1 Tax=Saccostrea cuccullata TaxID=36930 RepID=UPI002ED5ACAB
MPHIPYTNSRPPYPPSPFPTLILSEPNHPIPSHSIPSLPLLVPYTNFRPPLHPLSPLYFSLPHSVIFLTPYSSLHSFLPLSQIPFPLSHSFPFSPISPHSSLPFPLSPQSHSPYSSLPTLSSLN